MNLNKNLLCIKWDEFDNFVVNGISNLYLKDEMADVTLFCDGRSFKAHKILLSVWSSYFREVLAATSHPHPVIILRETASSDLELILRFIYQGQLFVPYEDADRFLKTAEYFQIAGLRNMRVHSSPEAGQDHGGGEVAFPANFSSNSQKPRAFTNTNHVSVPSAAPAHTSFGSQTLPFPHAVRSGTLPVGGSTTGRILSDSHSPLSTVSSQIHHSSNSSASSASETTAFPHNQYSTTNVIKSHSRPQKGFSQRNVTLSPVQASTYPSSGNSAGMLNAEHIVYETQPVLMFQNQQKANEYYGNKNAHSAGSSRPTEAVVIIESTENINNHVQISSLNPESLQLHRNFSTNSSLALYSHSNHVPTSSSSVPQQEEVLGLTYLSDNNADVQNQSHIIQEAAAAAGVSTEETIIVRDETPSTTVGVGSSIGKNFYKPTMIVTTTETPVYAVKRVPATGNTNPAVGSVKNSPAVNSTADRRPKPKRPPPNSRLSKQVKIKDEKGNNSRVELVNCPKCEKRVKSTSLKVHIKRTHLEEGTKLTCPVCGKQISSKGVYYKHMYLHRQNKKGGKLRVEEQK